MTADLRVTTDHPITNQIGIPDYVLSPDPSAVDMSCGE